MPSDKQIDPLLARLRNAGPGRRTNTIGAGIIDPALMRQLQMMQPRIMGGSKMPGFNPSQIPYKPQAPSVQDILAKYPKPPGMGPQPDVNIPIPRLPEKGRNDKAEQNPAIVPYLNMLKEEGVARGVYISPAHGSAYIYYGPKGAERMFTLRVPHPDKPHIGKVRKEEDVGKFIDTAGMENIPASWHRGGPNAHIEGSLRNAAGGSFSDINNVRDAVRWQLGKLVPVGSEPFQNSPDFTPKPAKGAAFHPKQEKTGQGQFMTKMMHNDEKQKLPTIMGGDPGNALHSQQLNQRFNLVNPQDLGNYGVKQYDPLTDPSYQALIKLLGRSGPNTSNDR